MISAQGTKKKLTMPQMQLNSGIQLMSCTLMPGPTLYLKMNQSMAKACTIVKAAFQLQY